ncbi:MAG: sigma-70 family RNA polymerase sigma factor [Planctomycetaceae bacterium]
MALLENDILRILMKSRDRIAAAAWIIVRDAQASEDIFQNVAIKAMTKEVRFDAEGAVLSWAMITARREAIDWARRHRSESTVLNNDILDLLEQEWLKASDRIDARSEALRACLRKLPRKSKELLRLRYLDGLACSNVAERLGAGLDVIYKRLSRLHQTLKDCIEGRLADSRTSRS